SGCQGPTLVASNSSFIDCATGQANIQYNPYSYNILSETWIFPDEALGETYILGANAWATASFEEAGVYPFNYFVETDSCTKGFHQNVYIPFVGDMYYSVSCGTGSLYDVTLYDHSNIFPLEVGSMQHLYAYSDDAGTSWNNISGTPSDLSVNFQLPAGDYQFREIIYSTFTTAAPPCTTIVSVNLPDKPDADFEIVSPFEPACINDVVVHLNNLSTPVTGLNYVWDFGEDNTNFQPNPDKVYASTGTQLITLTATSSIGCSDSTQNTIEIQDNGLWNGTKPNLLINPAPPVCIGIPITLTYFDISFDDPTGFIWYQGSIPVTPIVTSSSFDVTYAGDYWVMGSDQYGCQVPSEPVSIYFTPLPTPTIIGNPNQCDSVPFTLTSSINTASGLSLEWERNPGGIVGNSATLLQTLPVGTYTYTLTATQNGCDGVSVPYTVTVASPVDTPAVSFNIASCEPYVVALSATNAQNGTYNWSNGSTGSTINGYHGGLYEVYFTSNSGCVSSNEIAVPHSPQEYMWNFPTGCFCTDDLRDGNDLTSCAAQAGIVGPYNPFAYWSYQVNGVDVSTGTGNHPLGFSNFGPDSINLILDNGFCQITSDAMYLSDSCSASGSQGLIANGTSPNNLDSQANTFNQNLEQLAPEIFLIPNPAADQTRIEYRYDGSKSQKMIEIYDLTGRKVKTLRLQSAAGSISMQLGDFVSGIYQICLMQDGHIIAQSKLSVAP
ncbi:T9SS type A sorting domain-containing protein, partial [Cryomorpha ignava]